MIVTAWNNSSYSNTGGGYGLTIRPTDRDRYFNRAWHTVTLDLPGESELVTANVKKRGFWNGCRHLIHKEIGIWLIKHGFGPWEKGSPPRFELTPLGGGRFKLNTISTPP